MNILEDELVRQYFIGVDSLQNMAQRVLQAMQEPIKRGDRCLLINHLGSIYETNQAEVDGFHSSVLRLPNRFQKKPDPVEEKINHLSTWWPIAEDKYRIQVLQRELHELVELAKKS